VKALQVKNGNQENAFSLAINTASFQSITINWWLINAKLTIRKY